MVRSKRLRLSLISGPVLGVLLVLSAAGSRAETTLAQFYTEGWRNLPWELGRAREATIPVTLWAEDTTILAQAADDSLLADVYTFYLPIIAKRWPPVPYAPTLRLLSNDTYGNYTLGWTYDYTELTPTSYRLQEATDAAFEALTFDGSATSPVVYTAKTPGWRYYRVRGINAYGEGDWSTVLGVLTNARDYYDGFTDPASGWYVGPAWRLHPDRGWEIVAEMSYNQGNYRIYVPMDWRGGGSVDTWFVWPVELAPTAGMSGPLPSHYCVEARAIFANSWAEDQPYWAHWGVVFGSNAERSEVFTFQINANQDFSMFRLHNYTYPGNRQIENEQVNVEIPIVPWGDRNLTWLISTAKYNKIKVAVRGVFADVYINDYQVVESANIGEMPRDRIGVVGGSWEVTPVDLRIDYFHYDPLCPEVQ